MSMQPGSTDHKSRPRPYRSPCLAPWVLSVATFGAGCTLFANSEACRAESLSEKARAAPGVTPDRREEMRFGRVTLGLERLVAFTYHRQTGYETFDVLAAPQLVVDLETPLGFTLGGAAGCAFKRDANSASAQGFFTLLRFGADWHIDETLSLWPRLGAKFGYSASKEPWVTLDAVVVDLPLAVAVNPDVTFLLGPGFQIGRSQAVTTVDFSMGLAVGL